MSEHDETECALCVHAKEHGWWGESETTHCRDCGASWRMSTATAHCTVCHSTFRSPGGFDAHRSSSGCLDPATMVFAETTQRAGEQMFDSHLNSHGTKVWSQSMNEAQIERLRGLT